MLEPFFGRVTHKVDAKGRVSLPSDIRRVAQEGDPYCADKRNDKCQVWLMQGRMKNCLMGYSAEGYQALYKTIFSLDQYDPEVAKLQDVAFENAKKIEVDETGRMGLKDMREALGDCDHVIFAGRGRHFEIWQPAAFENRDAIRASAAETDPFRLLSRLTNNEKPA